MEFIKNVNLEETHLDYSSNDENYPNINTPRMDQLAFLRPHLFSHTHTFSSLSSFPFHNTFECDKADDAQGIPVSEERPVLPTLPSLENDEIDMELDKEDYLVLNLEVDSSDGSLQALQQILKSENVGKRDIFVQLLQCLFDQVDETRKYECYIAITEALNDVHENNSHCEAEFAEKELKIGNL